MNKLGSSYICIIIIHIIISGKAKHPPFGLNLNDAKDFFSRDGEAKSGTSDCTPGHQTSDRDVNIDAMYDFYKTNR